MHVRDDSPFGGPDPPATLFRYSRNSLGVHPVEHLRVFYGILQSDAFAGYNRGNEPSRMPGPVTDTACSAHARSKYYELADIAAGKRRGKNAPPILPLAMEAVKLIDALFDIQRGIDEGTAERSLALRREQSAPLLADLKNWMRVEHAGLSRNSSWPRP